MNMLTKTLLVTVGIFVAALVGTNVHAATLNEAAAATYKLYEGERGICSTTFIGNDNLGAIFLTAAHCVDGKDLNFRTQKLNDKYEITSETINYLKVLRSSKEDDTAIMQVTDPSVTLAIHAADMAVPDDEKTLVFGQDLIALGYPAADQKSITKGNFTNKIKGVLDVKEQYQTTVPLAGGNSGGGLWTYFCDNAVPKATCEYKLIGTASAKRGDNDIMTYFSTIGAVNRITAGFLSNKHSSPIDKNMLPGGLTDEK